jgi:hypothetical protein
MERKRTQETGRNELFSRKSERMGSFSAQGLLFLDGRSIHSIVGVAASNMGC